MNILKSLKIKLIPDSLDYLEISGLRKEAMQKLDKFRPRSIGQASRISGVSPADISVLLVYLESLRRKALIIDKEKCMINETFKNNLNSIGVELTDRQYEQFDMYYKCWLNGIAL